MINKRLKIAGLALLLAGAGMLPFKDVLFKNDLLYKPFGLGSDLSAYGGDGEDIRGAVGYNFVRKADLTTGMIDMAEVFKVMTQLDNKPMHKEGSFLQWREMGPDNIGGRTRSIVIDKDNPNILYIGAVSGGVWKSTNAGTNWKRAGGRDLNSLIVNCMVQTADGTILYGTGEQIFTRGAEGDGNSGFIGRGVYRSTDRAESFQQLESTDPTKPWVNSEAWDNVNGLFAVPGEAAKVYAATQNGLYLTTDKGDTWNVVNTGSPSIQQNCTDIRISPDGTMIWIVMQNKQKSSASIYRSKDAGASWQRVDNSASSPEKINTALSRAVIAIAPSRPNTVYVSAAKNSNNTLDGIYVTDDAGETWRKIVTGGLSNDPFTGGTNGSNGQGDYDNCIAVDPVDHNKFFVGGVHLFKGTRVGPQTQWEPITFLFKAEGTHNPYYIHSDKHAIIFDTVSKPYNMYVGTDGGVFKSTNISKTNENAMFIPLNNGYGSIQFYGLGISPTHRDTVIGGTQDNGTLLVGRGGISEQNANSILGGDGGYAAIGKIKRIYFAENQYGALQRSLDGKNFSDFYDANIPLSGLGRYPFVTPFRLWEEIDYDTSIVFNPETGKNDTSIFLNPYASKLFVVAFNGASCDLYMTSGALVLDKTPTWYKVASIASLSPHSLEVSADGDAVYIGGRTGNSGRVFRVTGFKNYKNFTGSGSTFNPQNFGISLPVGIFTRTGAVVTGMGLNPRNGNQAVITLGSYNTTLPHVFMTDNLLATTPSFTDYSGNLPGFPVYGAAINPEKPSEVIIGTEFGIWHTSDIKGKVWKEENNGMERVPTFMVDFREYPNSDVDGPVFFAATHGRGIFRTETLARVGVKDEEAANKRQPELNIYPNPANEMTNLNLTLGKASDVSISIYNIQGKLVESYNHRSQPSGERKFNINTSAYKAGTYFVKVTAQGVEKTSKLLVVK